MSGSTSPGGMGAVKSSCCWAGREALVHPLGGGIPRLIAFLGALMPELSIFIDESGDRGAAQDHSPFYILSLVFYDQRDDISGHLDKIHDALRARGLSADHALHTGTLIRRENDYRWLEMPARRSLFRVLVDFVRTSEVTHHSWVFTKREMSDTDRLLSAMARELGALIRTHHEYFNFWDRVVIHYDNGQKEITNLVNSIFNAHLGNVDVRKVVPSNYSLFQAADLCCTLALLRRKIETIGLSKSERSFFSTPKDGPERALKKGYFKTVDRNRFGT
jgi:hypothetical protein